MACWSVGLCRVKGWPVHPGTFVSGCAALRGDVAPVLPWYFRSPLPSAYAD
uniref:Uncharacterized protein n=2 Tax=Enterobacteriaceae TaxID=543 RepID=A0A1C3NEQ3_ECOLX|nr:hypothetical protein [Klebsiella pneumoniae]API81989.1 hypothetical protein pECMCR-1101-0003 [Escherichia coli]UDP42727.1 hypothetical protein [Salmonella enterica subsp. enterica serovar Typhimurium]UHA79853.1 hypothetical protein [Salmonella enterica]API82036.1 hypothetical protein pECMCR-1101-0050 [Escherichia coli]